MLKNFLNLKTTDYMQKEKVKKKLTVEEHYRGMPEFVQNNIGKKFMKITVHINSEKDALRFFKLIGQKFSPKTRTVFFPEESETPCMNKRYSDKK